MDQHVSSAQLVKKSEIEDGAVEADATRPKPPSSFIPSLLQSCFTNWTPGTSHSWIECEFVARNPSPPLPSFPLSIVLRISWQVAGTHSYWLERSTWSVLSIVRCPSSPLTVSYPSILGSCVVWTATVQLCSWYGYLWLPWHQLLQNKTYG